MDWKPQKQMVQQHRQVVKGNSWVNIYVALFLIQPMLCAINLNNQRALQHFLSGDLKLFDTVRVVCDKKTRSSLMVDSRDALHIPFDVIRNFTGKN